MPFVLGDFQEAATIEDVVAGVSRQLERPFDAMGHDGPELVRLGDEWFLYVRTPGNNETERFRLDLRGGGPTR